MRNMNEFPLTGENIKAALEGDKELLQENTAYESLLSDFKTRKRNREERNKQTAGREILRADLPVYEVKVRRQAVVLKVLE